jgi:hypothetical protein
MLNATFAPTIERVLGRMQCLNAISMTNSTATTLHVDGETRVLTR